MTQPNLHQLHTTLGGFLRRANDQETPAQQQPLGRVVTDSREVQPGDVFWALPGTQHNGAEFAEDAFARGASGVVTQQSVSAPPWGCWTLQVDNSLTALWQWAAWVRQQFRGTLIAVTGSVGKTTTRQMIYAALSQTLRGSASPKNYNNQVGVPLSLLQLEPDHDFAVIELGASALGEIAALARLVAPQIGVLTSIGQAHLPGFGSQQAIASAKAELLDQLPADGLAVMNGDDLWLHRVADRSAAPVMWVGRRSDCSLTADRVRCQDGWLSCTVAAEEYRVPVWGRHYLTSVLCAIAVARSLGVSPAHIAAGLSQFHSPPMRCQVEWRHDVAWIYDAYNSSPSAARVALELLRDFNHEGRKIVALGNMCELGDSTAEFHRTLGEQVATLCGADRLVACGSQAEQIAQAAYQAGMPVEHIAVCSEVSDMIAVLDHWLLPGDAVLLKGSRAMQLERVFDTVAYAANPRMSIPMTPAVAWPMYKTA